MQSETHDKPPARVADGRGPASGVHRLEFVRRWRLTCPLKVVMVVANSGGRCLAARCLDRGRERVGSHLPSRLQGGERALMSDHKVTLKRCLLGLASCLVFGASSPILAACEVKEACDVALERTDDYNYQLAVCQGRKWLVCGTNTAASPYILRAHPFQMEDGVDFYWAVPASDDYQIVHASTSHKLEQTLSVYRSGRKGVVPIFPPNEEVDEQLAVNQPRRRFREYHKGPQPPVARDPISEVLSLWHQTEYVGLLKSYGLVGSSLNLNESDQPALAAERLLRLAKNRPKTSWVKFDSLVEPGSPLRIILAYSGRTGYRGYKSRTWQFHFDVDPVLAAE